MAANNSESRLRRVSIARTANGLHGVLIGHKAENVAGDVACDAVQKIQ